MSCAPYYTVSNLNVLERPPSTWSPSTTTSPFDVSMDPLLSMLQNAAGRSAQPSQQLQSPPQQHSQNGPRPGSQTLDQLFASLTSPQSQTASLPSSHSAPNATSLNQGGRQAQLLGLLKGSASTPEPMGSVPPPGEAGNVIARAASPQEERAQQMLASLMGQ